MDVDYSRDASYKIVYYGPARSGKTANIEVVHAKSPRDSRGDLVSVASHTDRGLRFDSLVLNLGIIRGMNTKFRLFTVPGQHSYNATRKLVLQGANGVIFVADSSPEMREENIGAVENLVENLRANGKDVRDVRLVFQWNKRDLPDAMTAEEMDADLNRWDAPACESVAVNGEGVFQAVKMMAALCLPKLPGGG